MSSAMYRAVLSGNHVDGFAMGCAWMKRFVQSLRRQSEKLPADQSRRRRLAPAESLALLAVEHINGCHFRQITAQSIYDCTTEASHRTLGRQTLTQSFPYSTDRRFQQEPEFPLRRASAFLLAILVFSMGHVVQAQLIVAHRGASHDAPENTLAAFRLAWEKQSDAIEGDFFLTKDNRIVCIHDKTTKRLAPQSPELVVAKSTFAQLRALDVGSWKDKRFAGEQVPTLKEVLATVPDGKQIFVEIKCGPEILPFLKPQLEQSGLKPAQIVIICFSETVVTKARKMMPQYKVNWLAGYKQETEQSEWKPSLDTVLATLKRSGATGLGTHENLEVIDQAFVDAVRAVGCEFHVWTVDKVNTARQFADFGTDSITTNRPAFIRNAVQPAAAQR